MEILGYSQSSSKPLSLDEIDSLNKEGFNAFCVMGSDLAQPIYTDEAWAEAFYARYEAIKAIGEKNGNPIKQMKVSIECTPTQNGYDWAKEIILEFQNCKDVIFYYDEPLNQVEEGRFTEKEVIDLLNSLQNATEIYCYRDLVIGIQRRLFPKLHLIAPFGSDCVISSYFEMAMKKPFLFVYGQFCYWHFFNSLRYGALKKKADSLGIDKFYLYQGEKGFITNLFNNILRRRFLKIFGRK